MLGVPELAVVLVIVLVLFGPKKLPDIGASLGKGIRDFKNAFDDEPPKQAAAPESLPNTGHEASAHERPPSS